MAPLIKRPRGITGTQLGLAVGLGVISGIYIWKPQFEEYWKKQAEDLKKKSELKVKQGEQ